MKIIETQQYKKYATYYTNLNTHPGFDSQVPSGVASHLFDNDDDVDEGDFGENKDDKKDKSQKTRRKRKPSERVPGRRETGEENKNDNKIPEKML